MNQFRTLTSALAPAPVPHEPGPADGTARLRQFCRSILDWLDADGDRVAHLPGLTQTLAGAIGTGAAAVIDRLSYEAAAFDAAVADLRALGSVRLVSPPPGLTDLISDLVVRRDLAALALDAIRQLNGADGLTLPVHRGSNPAEPEAGARAEPDGWPPPSLPLRAPAYLADEDPSPHTFTVARDIVA